MKKPEKFVETIIEFLKKTIPIPIVLPKIGLFEMLKVKSSEELAKLLSNLIIVPLKPPDVSKIVNELADKFKKLREVK